jgi:hypothetical protein
MKSDRTVVVDHFDHRGFPKCFSWSAVLVGAFVGLGLSFLLNLFNLAIGLSAFTTSSEGMKTLAVGGLVGVALGGIISMYFAGMATGYLARPYCNRRHLATAYGFTTWSVILVATILLATHIGNFVNYSSNMLSNTPTTVTAVDTTSNSAAPLATDTKASDGTTVTTVNAEKAANGLGTAAFITFFLFFLGAIFACLGAHHGLTCCRDDLSEIK